MVMAVLRVQKRLLFMMQCPVSQGCRKGSIKGYTRWWRRSKSVTSKSMEVNSIANGQMMAGVDRRVK